jgi:hypothetical protein
MKRQRKRKRRGRGTGREKGRVKGRERGIGRGRGREENSTKTNLKWFVDSEGKHTILRCQRSTRPAEVQEEGE